MPTYQYACTDCGDRTEAVQKFTDDPLSVCATCGGRLRKVFSPVGIVFKGSGFYRTDSRSNSTVPADGGKDKARNGSDSSSSGDAPASKNGSDSGSSESGKKSEKTGSSSGSSSASGSSASGKSSDNSSSGSSSGSKVA